MNLFTIGFTKKSAKDFFELIKFYKIDLLIDIRLNNKSQLTGFTKGNDLEYFLKKICDCEYKHCLEYAPTKEILDAYKKNKITWETYENKYYLLMNERNNIKDFYKKYIDYKNICLLCSEATPEHCHRRLAAEMILNYNKHIVLKHI